MVVIIEDSQKSKVDDCTSHVSPERRLGSFSCGMWEENPRKLRKNQRRQVGTENQNHLVPPAGFKQGSLQWKARIETITPTIN